MSRYVNVYRLHEMYGGPEEGGWWFTAYEPLKTVKAGNRRIQKKKIKQLQMKYAGMNHGRLGEILGGNPNDLDSNEDFDPNDDFGLDIGTEIRVMVERRKAWHRPRPHYE